MCPNYLARGYQGWHVKQTKTNKQTQENWSILCHNLIYQQHVLLLSNTFFKSEIKYDTIAVFCLLLKILGGFLSYPMFTLATISIFWIASNYVILYQTFWKWNLANWYIHLHAEAILQQTISIFNSLLERW